MPGHTCIRKNAVQGNTPYGGGQRSFSEQIAVRPGPGQGQHQNIILNAVDKQPVGQHMALTVSGPVPGQGVVPVFLREGDSHGKVGDHALQQMNVQSTPHCQLVIFPELCGGLDGIFAFFMLSGLRTVRPDRYTLSLPGLSQSFLPPA